MATPISTTYESIAILLNTRSPEERDELTKQWRDHKLGELNFIGVVAGLVASCLTSTGSWPTVLPDDSEAPWTVRMFWYSGVILSFASVLSAAFQTIRLHRLSTHRDALQEIRRIMTAPPRRSSSPGNPLSRAGRAVARGLQRDGEVQSELGANSANDGDWEIKPRMIQVWAWQSSTVFLAGSVVCMICGMFVLVWSSTGTYVQEVWWDGYAKVAVTLTVVLVTTVFGFVGMQMALYPVVDGKVQLEY